MANFPKELTDLVEEYLTDGIITAKERQVLLKKAVNMGVDEDEFDLYLDAQQQKVDQATDAAAAKKRGKACPFCGASIPQLTDKCPECGKTVTAEASKELEEILEKLEDALVDYKAGREIGRNRAIVEKYSRKAKIYYSSHPKIKAILAEVDQELSVAEAAAKKQALTNATLKNKWVWLFLILLLGITLTAIGSTNQLWDIMGVGNLLILSSLFLGLIFIIVSYLKSFLKK